MSVRLRFTALLMIIVIINGIVGLSIFSYINTQKEYSRYINLAGRQRALAQKMTKEVLLFREGYADIKAEFGRTRALFEKTLLGFLEGDPEQGLESVKNNLLREQLNEMLVLWKEHKEYLNLIVQGSSYSGQDLNDQTMKIFEKADAITRSFEETAQKEAVGPFRLLVGGVLLITIFALGGWLFLDRKAIKPLAVLSGRVEKIAGGDLLVEKMQYKSQDEIGILIKALNSLQDNFQKIILKVVETTAG